MHRVEIRSAGRSAAIACSADEPVLMAGLRDGLPLRHDCASGSCRACRARLVSGYVRDLSSGQTQGASSAPPGPEILLCQVTPVSPCAFEANLGTGSLPIPVGCFSGEIERAGECALDVWQLEIRLDRPMLFSPGQFIRLELPEFPSGRAYSIAQGPQRSDDIIKIYVQRKPGGRATAVLCRDDILGRRVRVYGPLGKASLPDTCRPHVVCIAGGTGISPMLSILDALDDRGLMQGRTAALFWGVRTPDHFFEAPGLNAFMDRYRDQARFLRVCSTPAPNLQETDSLKKGFVHEAVERFGQHLPDAEIFIAGPPPMVDATIRMLVRQKVRLNAIHYDRFA